MSNAAPPPGSHQLSTFDQKRQRFQEFMIRNESRLQQIAPKNVSIGRQMEIILKLCDETPQLLECDPKSVWMGALEATRFGLEPGSSTGHCWLIPRKDKRRGDGQFAIFQFGYKGLIQLAHRTEAVSFVDAGVVKEGDFFQYEFGSEAILKHRPSLEESRLTATVTAVWGLVKFRDGSTKFVVLSKSEVEEIRLASRATSGPWISHWDEMAKKSALIRVLKTSPLSAEFSEAVSLDELGAAGRHNLADRYDTATKEKPVSEEDKKNAEETTVEPNPEGYDGSSQPAGFPSEDDF